MGKHRPEGFEYQAMNGYWYRKVDGKWKLIHHIVAEEKLGRKIDPKEERVTFRDNDRDNLSPDNIIVKPKSGGRLKRIAQLEERIAKLQEELDLLRSK